LLRPATRDRRRSLLSGSVLQNSYSLKPADPLS
jgi:hypothetical protein